MVRLTTPEQIVKLPPGFNPAQVQWIRWSYSQGDKIILEKKLSEVNVDADGFSFDMTQEESGRFKGSEYAIVQLRFGIGTKAYASKKVRIYVEDVLNDSVVEVD